ncbi:MAG: cytochrome b/b6 domain-containing protein [Bacteroidota bacterium]
MRTYIWTLPTRIFHWLLAIGFTSAYILGDIDNFSNLHFAFGAFVGALIIFRLLFGLFGPAYSRFKDFPVGLKKQIEFFRTYFLNTKFYAGHNPTASVVMLLILLNGLICGISGYLLYATESNVLNIGINEEFLKESHEVFANVFLVLIGLHLLGIIGETLFHGKTGTLQSIFTGYKNIDTQNATLNNYQKAYIILWFIVPFYFFYLAYGLQINAKDKDPKYEGTEHFEQDDD